MPPRVTQEEWDRRAAAAGIQWLEEVRNNRTKARARCLVCGYEYARTPDSVQADQQCPHCSGRVVLQSEWDERAAAIGLEWVDDVVGARTPTRIRCRTCGREWKTKPEYVKSGNGCQDCYDQRCGESLKVPQEIWDQRAAESGMRWLDPVPPQPAACPRGRAICSRPRRQSRLPGRTRDVRGIRQERTTKGKRSRRIV